MTYRKIGTVHAHRVIAERKIGRKLRRGEVVHHIDGDEENNEPNNLMVLASQAEHARLHNTGTKRTPIQFCKRGHRFTEANTGRGSKGERRCLICSRAYSAKWHRDKRRARGLRKPGRKRGTARSHHARNSLKS